VRRGEGIREEKGRRGTEKRGEVCPLIGESGSASGEGEGKGRRARGAWIGASRHFFVFTLSTVFTHCNKANF